MGRLVIDLTPEGGDKYHVSVEVMDDAKPQELLHLVCAAEYLTYLVATKSEMGFEAALDAVSFGAQTWRHRADKPEEQAE